MPLAAFLMSISGSIAARVLLSLGIGWITYAGFDAFADQAKTAVLANFSGIHPDVLAIIGLAGFSQAVGIVLGALAARAALSAVSVLGRKAAP